VHAIDLNGGLPVWTFKARLDVDSSPLISGGRVYVGSKDKSLYVLDLKTGQSIWEFKASRAITASPAIAAGVLVIGDDAGNVYCLEPGGG
jgi:outer membrane protein assembly factor BamB